VLPVLVGCLPTGKQDAQHVARGNLVAALQICTHFYHPGYAHHCCMPQPEDMSIAVP
jgi:hypothetical protein